MENDKIILFINKNDCNGCGCCFLVCPCHAICMEIDEEGFEYPKVDYTKCIKCSKCIKTCPIMGRDNERD